VLKIDSLLFNKNDKIITFIMKKIKSFLTTFAVVAIVGSALAVKANFFGQGSVFCAFDCSNGSRVSFRISCNGNAANPCGTTNGVENRSYAIDGTCHCTLNNLGLKYDAVSAGN